MEAMLPPTSLPNDMGAWLVHCYIGADFGATKCVNCVSSSSLIGFCRKASPGLEIETLNRDQGQRSGQMREPVYDQHSNGKPHGAKYGLEAWCAEQRQDWSGCVGGLLRFSDAPSSVRREYCLSSIRGGEDVLVWETIPCWFACIEQGPELGGFEPLSLERLDDAQRCPAISSGKRTVTKLSSWHQLISSTRSEDSLDIM